MWNEITFSVVTINWLIDSFNPCAIGVLVATVSILFALWNYREHIMRFWFFYIFSIFITYLFIGLWILKAVHLFGIHNFFWWLSAIVLIFIGIYQLRNSMCIIPKNTPKEATIVSWIIFWFLVWLCEFPCSWWIYLATVWFIWLQETFWNWLMYLIWYNFLFILR